MREVRRITGVPETKLRAAADLLGTAPTLVSAVLQGVYQSNQATAAACQVNNINLLLGQIGKPGCGVLQMNGQPTAQNTRETGCDGEFPFFLINWQKTGEEVEVTSRRGTIRGVARVGDIETGHVFVPFHYGYWDAQDEEFHRAANELTLWGWDLGQVVGVHIALAFLKDGLFDVTAAGTIARCGYRGDYTEVTHLFEMLRPLL